jgi:hypothetical protein
VHRDLITKPAVRPNLPAVYGNRSNVNSGGLIFYGPNRIDHYDARPLMSIAFSGTKSRPNFRFKLRPSTIR